jgi:tetratricopeptide (TPR) repeat protein
VLLEAPETVLPYDWLAICLYDGQPDRAAELLRADPGFRYRVDVDIRAYALRDAALASGRYAETLEALRNLPSHLAPPDMEPFTLVALAQVYLALGDRSEAESLARSVRADFNRQKYARAAALTLLAENDAALNLLEEDYAEQDRRRWWYFFERDAGFDAIRGDPRFQTLATSARAHAAAEREKLERMRERAQVPVRKGKESSGAGVCQR